MAKGKYKKLSDLYTTGTELVFTDEDGNLTVMWLQVMNPFEVDDARKDAQAARGRLTNALKTVGSLDYDAALGTFLSRGKEAAVTDLVNSKSLDWYVKAQNDIEVDPDWKERMTIMQRSVGDNAEALSDEEKAYLNEINGEWLAELDKRLREEQEYNSGRWNRMSDEDLIEDYREIYLERRGNDIAVAEYNITEMFYGCRMCDAVPVEGFFSKDAHVSCNHKEQVYDSKLEVRQLPDLLVTRLRDAFDGLALSVRDARFSPRQGSSSGSSPLPSEEAVSTVSIQDATPESAPGTSPQLSLTH